MATFFIVFGSLLFIISLSYTIYLVNMEDELLREKHLIDEINYCTYQTKVCERKIEVYQSKIMFYKNELLKLGNKDIEIETTEK